MNTPTAGTFFLPPPIPASHARANGKRFFHAADSPYAKWREEAASIVRLNWPFPPMLGPIELIIACVTERPGNKPTWCSLDVWKTGKRIYRAGRPDLENFEEAIQDALQLPARKEGIVHIRSVPNDQVRGYPLRDDGQVTRVLAEDWLAGVGEAPRTIVVVRSIGWFGPE